ncbi:IS3 family transposase [Streptomyces sp. NPDC056231]|uniref:IS3 family transposase n=1 Tax=Streptomyces sp. NPDC056231 TaxID=3345755 RepID=UPI003AAB22ED
MSELYRSVHAEKANYPIALLCRVLHVARSSYYAWRESEAARRARQAADDSLAYEITVLHLASRKTYGVPRIHAELRRLGRQVNRKRVAHVMRERDIRGVTRRKHRLLTRPDKKAKPAPDLMGRDFHAERPGIKLVGAAVDQQGLGRHPGQPAAAVLTALAAVAPAVRDHRDFGHRRLQRLRPEQQPGQVEPVEVAQMVVIGEAGWFGDVADAQGKFAEVVEDHAAGRADPTVAGPPAPWSHPEPTAGVLP